MKKRLLILTSIASLAFFDSQFWPLDQAEKTWGLVTFSAEKFKTADGATRAKMALDLIKRGLFVGEKFQRVEKALGKPDAQFDSRRYPAYRIGGGTTEPAILVFLPDYTNQRVEEVRIAKLDSDPSTNSVSGTSVGAKLLPVEIQGDSAKAIYDQMTTIKDEGGKKAGKNITCQRAPQYRCSFVVDEQGQASGH